MGTSYDELRQQCREIALMLEYPPTVTDEGVPVLEEYPDAHLTGDGEYVSGWKYCVPVDERKHYTFCEDTQSWTVVPTGEEFSVGDWFETADDTLILGGEVVDGTRPMTASDYLQDALDVNFTVGADRSYRSGEVLLAYGGPTIRLDTGSNCIRGHWWRDEVSVPYRDNLGVDEYLSEMWEQGA